MAEEQISTKTKKSGGSAKYILIGIILLSLIAVIVYFYEQNEKLEAEKIQKEQALELAYFQLDSISNELNDKILTISQLGGEIDTLLIIQEQLENEKRSLLDREKRQTKSIEALQDRVDGYQELLLLKDEEIKQLTEINEKLLSENSELKSEAQVLNQSIRSINDAKSDLESMIQKASRLLIEGVKVFGIDAKNREREQEFRNRQLEQIKIRFYVTENTVAPIEGKDLLIRIVAPDGNVLFDVARGSGSFFFEGRELFYTSRKEILYDRSRQQVEVYYDKGSDYSLGLHRVEVYTDEYLMGTGTFTVK